MGRHFGEMKPMIHLRDSLALLSSYALMWFMCASCHHSSEPLSLPPDTTSHVIVWRTDTIGVGNSFMGGVAIIDEQNVWAVGEFYFRDSLGVIDEETMYNVLRWDGTRWTPRRLPFTYNGQQYVMSGVAVFGFSADDMWIAADAPEHWNGQGLTNVDLGNAIHGHVQGFWGTSSSDLYVIATSGNLAHYDGMRFTEIPTGVQSRFSDITGRGDQVYVSSYYYDNQIRPSGVFSYKQGKFEFLFPDALDTSTFRLMSDALGIWMSPQGTLWAVASQYVFRPFQSHDPVFTNSSALWCIRGNSDADVWIAGDRPGVLHYNGNSWHKYSDAELGTTGLYPLYKTIAVKGDLVVMGGYLSFSDGAVVTVGKRVP
jgi:hypothetical protein